MKIPERVQLEGAENELHANRQPRYYQSMAYVHISLSLTHTQYISIVCSLKPYSNAVVSANFQRICYNYKDLEDGL